MGVTLLWLGAGNLVAAATDDAAGRVVRGFNVVNVLGLALLVGLFAFYRIPPPLLTLAAVEALFVLALALPARRRLGRGP
jgi:hypothetical protein